MKRIKRLWLIVRVCRNFPAILRAKFSGSVPPVKTWSGATFEVGNLNSNLVSILEVYGEKQYGHKFSGTVIDIGANVGAFSVFAAESGAHVYAYEPEPKNYSLLRKNTAGRHVKTSQVAVDGSRGERQLFLTGEYSGKNSFFSSSHSKRSITVPCVTLEDILKEVGQCDTLKIDCEGAEYRILYGLPRASYRKIRAICLEWHHVEGESAEKLTAHLREMGFSVSRPRSFESIIHALRIEA